MSHPTKSKSEAKPITIEADLAPALLVPDPNNRQVAEEADAGGEEWEQFVDSIRVRGILQRLEVCDRGDGKYDLIEGERRWRAASAIGLAAVPARVWPAGTSRADLIELGLIINVMRKEHGCLEIAARLRELKNQHAATLEQLATRTGVKLDQVKRYIMLYEASDELLAFFQAEKPPLRVAVELARFYKRHGELALRRLLAQAAAEPLTVALVVAARKRLEKQGGADPEPRAKSAGSGRPRFVASLLTALGERPEETAGALQAALLPLGYQLIRFEGQSVDPAADRAALGAFLRTRGGELVSPTASTPPAAE